MKQEKPLTLIQKIEIFDHAAMRVLEKRRVPYVTKTLSIVTKTASGKSWCLLSAILFFLNYLQISVMPQQNVFLHSLFAPLIAWGVSTFLKRVIGRKRPYELIKDFSIATSYPTCASFPSSHTSSSVALLAALTLAHHPLAIPVAIWATIVSFSRAYLGVHFPTDLLGGILIGVISGFLV